MLHGYTEGRKDAYGTPEQEYLRAYADAAAGVRNGTYKDAADHYEKVGKAQGYTAGFGDLTESLRKAGEDFSNRVMNDYRYIRSGYINPSQEFIATYNPGLIMALSDNPLVTEGATELFKNNISGSLEKDLINNFVISAGFKSEDEALQALQSRGGVSAAEAIELLNNVGKGSRAAARTLIGVSNYINDPDGATNLLDAFSKSKELTDLAAEGTLGELATALGDVGKFLDIGSAGGELLTTIGNSIGDYLGVSELGTSIAGSVGEYAGPITELLIAAGTAEDYEDFTKSASSIIAKAAINAVIPGAGVVLAIDAIASSLLGYQSPLQQALDLISRPINWGFTRLGRFWEFDWSMAEGGLIDLSTEMSYYDPTVMGQGVLPDIETYAQGGIIPLLGGGKIARGPGGGLDDLIPTSIDGKRAAALSDGEFVIPADVVSMMGDGSSNAGAKRLYDMVRQVRQSKTGTTKQAGPLPTGKILERVMR